MSFGPFCIGTDKITSFICCVQNNKACILMFKSKIPGQVLYTFPISFISLIMVAVGNLVRHRKIIPFAFNFFQVRYIVMKNISVDYGKINAPVIFFKIDPMNHLVMMPSILRICLSVMSIRCNCKTAQ